MGIVDTITSLGTMAFALTVAYVGLDFLLFGDRTVMGVAFLALAALMVLVPKYITTPGDLVGAITGRAAETVVVEEDGEEE